MKYNSLTKKEQEGFGCVVVLASIFLMLGCGFLFGWGITFLVIGVCWAAFAALVLIAK